jgi:nicotinamidase-related amidase
MTIPYVLCLAAAAVAAALLTAVGPARAAPAYPPTLREIRGGDRPAIDPTHAAVIIIDAQKEYMRGPLALEGMLTALDEIARARAWAAANGIPVIHVRQESAADSAVFAARSDGAQFIPKAAPATGESIVAKRYPNAFNKTELDALLKRTDRKQVILAGFMAHMCLDSTARAAFDLDYTVFVLASATAERAIHDPGAGTISAAELRYATMSALNDRFAWIVPTAADLP